MAYRKAEVRRESETKIILITTDAAHKKASRERYRPARGRLCGLRAGPVRRVVGRRRRGRWWAGGGGVGGEGRCNGLSSDVWHRYKRRGASSSSDRLVVTHYICIYNCTDAAAAAVLYIYSCVCVCVCVQCTREHYTRVVGTGCSFHLIRDPPPRTSV